MGVTCGADVQGRRFFYDRQNAKHEQPNAPQKPAKSLTGAFDKRALS